MAGHLSEKGKLFGGESTDYNVRAAITAINRLAGGLARREHREKHSRFTSGKPAG
jgi:hypothetical protein